MVGDELDELGRRNQEKLRTTVTVGESLLAEWV